MPVLETIAAVATIVGAFQTAAGLYNSWKARKEATERANESARNRDNDTQRSLVVGRRQIQEAYDRAFARLGTRFARGDDEGHAQLQTEIILLQHTVVALLQEAGSCRSLTTSQLIASLGDRRAGTIRALDNQYQRLSVAAPIRSSQVDEARSDYFAFASNLHLEQMARRCPTSLFKGKAVLKGYRWQVNERGYANIVESPSDNVEGLVFTVRYEDQLVLDRYEGVRKGLYECRPMSVHLAQCVEGPWKTPYVVRQLKSGHVPRHAARKVVIDALVYVSSTYVTDGKIRAEYAERLKLGIDDGVALGMSKQYVRRYLETHVVTSRPRSGNGLTAWLAGNPPTRHLLNG